MPGEAGRRMLWKKKKPRQRLKSLLLLIWELMNKQEEWNSQDSTS